MVQDHVGILLPLNVAQCVGLSFADHHTSKVDYDLATLVDRGLRTMFGFVSTGPCSVMMRCQNVTMLSVGVGMRLAEHARADITVVGRCSVPVHNA